MKEDRKIEQTYRHKEVVARSYKIIISKDNKHKDLQKASFRILMESLGLNPALLWGSMPVAAHAQNQHVRLFVMFQRVGNDAVGL